MIKYIKSWRWRREKRIFINLARQGNWKQLTWINGVQSIKNEDQKALEKEEHTKERWINHLFIYFLGGGQVRQKSYFEIFLMQVIWKIGVD